MKRVFSALLIVLAASVAFADSGYDRPLDAELQMVFKDYANIPLAEFAVGDLFDIAGQLSIPLQEQAYIRKAAFASMIVPGFGQFVTEDAVAGSLYLTADLLIGAGAMAAMYFLLPPELQFDQLDYFNATSAEIKTAWQTAIDGLTFTDALPSIGVAMGSMLLQHGLRFFSARQAADQAYSNIEDGTVTFAPRPMIVLDRMGRMGFGMGLRY